MNTKTKRTAITRAAAAVPLADEPAVKTRRQQNCAAQHFGAWAVLPKWMTQATEAVRAGAWQSSPFCSDEDTDDYGDYDVLDNGVALISITGQMTKHRSSFGGCSSIETRIALRKAERNPDVRAIVLRIDTPGGTVAGTAELAAEVIRVRKAGKPVYAHVDDLCCSAGYWVASQATAISANEASLIGCIGTYVVLEDSTGAQEKMGLKYRVVSTGPYKGLGADGVVSDELVADAQREVDELNQPFLAAVANGRKTDSETVAKWADGRAHAASQALALGLIDRICTLDAAVDTLSTLNKESTMANANPQAAAIPRAEETTDEVVIDTESADYKAGYDAGYRDGVASVTPSDETASNARKAEMDRYKAIVEASGGNYELAHGFYTAGQSAESAKLAADAVAKANDKAKAEAEAKAQEIERLKFEASGRGPVGVATPAPAGGDPEDPKAVAAKEWDTDDKVRVGFSSKENYVNYRAAQLAGRIRG